MTDGRPAPDFDIAVSFAGEDRSYVNDVVRAVDADLAVFYDEDNLVQTWGEDLVDFFSTLYSSRTRYVIIFVSRHYADKAWPRLERRAALSKAMTQRSAYVLPIRLDDTELEGLLPTVGFLDARRLGLDKIADAIRQKVSSPSTTPLARPTLPFIPSNQREIERILTERPEWWEYRLYAGMLQLNLAELEPSYRDYSIGYARPDGTFVHTADLTTYCSAALSQLLSITKNLEAVLDADVQESAFGKPGEPGDPDRITHLATRFVTVYEDLIFWATTIRAASTRTDEGTRALRALARYAEQPVESCRTFVRDFAASVGEVPRVIASGSKVEIKMAVVFEISDSVRENYERALEVAAMQ